ncbi:MAG: OadG family protein [Bacteroidales bacterium]|nr:OadG family protein [Bacteroidales bacterium]
MKIIKKLLTTGLFVMALGTTPLWAQLDNQSASEDSLTHFEYNNQKEERVLDERHFISYRFGCVGDNGPLVVIDSTDNAVDIIFLNENSTCDTTIRFIADEPHGRHDLANILRPKSVAFYEEYVIFVASSKKDSSYLAVIDFDGNLVNRVDFGCCAQAFEIYRDKIIVAGRNQLGYDYIFLSLANGVEGLSTDSTMCSRIHYHIPKQADRIRESDPVGIGLTVVAVSVVFLALLCISLILKGYGKLIMKTQDRKASKSMSNKDAVAAVPSASETSGEIYAAIATAIYLYDEEMHDEENTVITIQKVERAWTPWNAKYYNMNHYFNNKR